MLPEEFDEWLDQLVLIVLEHQGVRSITAQAR